jgi:hypothetical protein
MTKVKEIRLNKVVKVDQDENTATILDTLFYYGSGLHGATGYKVAFLNKVYVDDMVDDQHICDYCEDAGLEEYVIDDILMGSIEEKIDFMIDTYDKDNDMLYEVGGFNPTDYPVIETLSCGRIFNKENDFPLEKDLEEYVTLFESEGDIDIDNVLKTLKERGIEYTYTNTLD